MSAPNELTRDEFRIAIRNGLGRIIQCLQRHAAEPYRDLIEHACTHHLAFDPQCEGSREDYLVEITDLAGGLSRFRESILTSLRTTDVYWDASQLFELARRLAEKGDQEARATMYETFADMVTRDRQYPGAYDIIELDGREGVEFVAREYGKRCRHDPDYWHCDHIRYFTNEDFEEGDVENLLLELSDDDRDIKGLVERIHSEDERAVKRSSDRLGKQELARMSFTDIMKNDPNYALLRHWAYWASEEFVLDAANALVHAVGDMQIGLLLGVFVRRAFPLSPEWLLGVLVDDKLSSLTRLRAKYALSLVESDEVRARALKDLANSGTFERGLHLLCSNYESSDADAIVSALREQSDEDAENLHEIGRGLLDLFEDDDRLVDGTEAMGWMYEHSPCSMCRMSAMRCLDDLGAIPDWMREEARFDCNQRVRDLVTD